ncbi:FGGY-family carbohydrate kinase [Cryobacterium sp. N19]|uniref:xylulokinase n=1 Tax=Cryobacterium sp. N19 TaxID=2048288 RepID=UPI000CE4F9DD|nr:FGGY-family carbohydrate kinase [Cryobacterium sp. N19]
MTVEYVLGVDLGTSSCKTVAFALDGHRVASASVAYPTVTDQRGGVRQDPEMWWAAVQSTIAKVQTVIGAGNLLSIGLSGQIGTHVLVDGEVRPLADAWTWQDGGASIALDEFERVLDSAVLGADLRTWLPPGPAWPLPRLLWLTKTFPAHIARAHYMLQPKDYILHRLTGRIISDSSSLRGVMKPTGEIHRPALDALGLSDLFPPVGQPTESAGEILATVADAISVPRGTRVFIGWNDFNCALVGTGVSATGDGFDIAGTSEHIGILGREPVTDGSINSVPYSMATEADSYVSYGVSSNGGSVTAWLGDTYLANLESADRNGRLAVLASGTEPASDGLMFLPYLHGERSPIWDSSATASYTGLTSSHGLGHMVRAALEGVAFNLRQIRDASPDNVERASLIRASGGPTAMHVWNSIKADVLNTPLAIMEEKDSAALGAAILAVVGSGLFPSPAAAMSAMTRIEYVVEPNLQTAARYEAAYQRYSTIYPALAQGQPTDTRSERYAS